MHKYGILIILSAETAVTTVTEILENVEETINDDTSVIPAGTMLEEVCCNRARRGNTLPSFFEWSKNSLPFWPSQSSTMPFSYVKILNSG